MRRRLAPVATLMIFCLCGSIKGQGADVLKRARGYEPYIIQSALRHRVDPRVLWTIAYLETRFNPKAVSPKGARGMMQFMPSTAARYGLKNPHDPVAAIEAAARYVRDLHVRFGGRLDLILSSYNAGEATVEAFREGKRLILSNGKVINPQGRKTGGVPPYRETRNYVISGAEVFSHISATATLYSEKPVQSHRAVTLPAVKKGRDEVEEATPAEVEQLKRGSIYILKEEPGPEITRKNSQSRPSIKPRSIYFRTDGAGCPSGRAD